MEQPTPAVAVRSLTRTFGTTSVIDDLDLTLPAGERLALVGGNGSGKTTLLRCIVGSLRPTSGDVTVFGHPAGSFPAREATGCSLAQERSFYLRLSGAENLRFFARVRGLGAGEAERRIREVTDELDLGEIVKRRVDRCSTGMTQQLALARALLGRSRLLILDEPTRSLDDDAKQRLWRAIERRPGTAVVIATHQHEDVDRCSRRLSLGD